MIERLTPVQKEIIRIRYLQELNRLKMKFLEHEAMTPVEYDTQRQVRENHNGYLLRNQMAMNAAPSNAAWIMGLMGAGGI